MNWATKRKIIYAVSFFIFLTAVFVYEARNILFPSPTCFDQKQNGFETGIDCGGVCSLRCTNQINKISVTWARAIKTGASTYDLVAMFTNKNLNSSPNKSDYLFTIYNKKGNMLDQIKGNTVVPVNSDFPVIIQNVPLKDFPYQVVATASSGNFYLTNELPSDPTIKVLGTNFEKGDISRLYANIQNTKLVVLNNVPFRAVLFDENRNTIAVGETIIDRLDKEEQKQIVFTWHNSFPPPTFIRVYPIMDPFSN